MQCSICQSTRFKPFRGRPLAKCSECGSLERHRDAFDVIATLKLGDVLYIGPEPCLAKKVRARCGRYVSSDLYPKYTQTVKSDLCSLPFGDAEFDTSICLHVLEHIVDSDAAMKELCRVSRTSVIMVPMVNGISFRDDSASTPDKRRRSHGQHNHEWQFGRLDFKDKLIAAGFKNVSSVGDVYLCQ